MKPCPELGHRSDLPLGQGMPRGAVGQPPRREALNPVNSPACQHRACAGRRSLKRVVGCSLLGRSPPPPPAPSKRLFPGISAEEGAHPVPEARRGEVKGGGGRVAAAAPLPPQQRPLTSRPPQGRLPFPSALPFTGGTPPPPALLPSPPQPQRSPPACPRLTACARAGPTVGEARPAAGALREEEEEQRGPARRAGAGGGGKAR